MMGFSWLDGRVVGNIGYAGKNSSKVNGIPSSLSCSLCSNLDMRNQQGKANITSEAPNLQ